MGYRVSSTAVAESATASDLYNGYRNGCCIGLYSGFYSGFYSRFYSGFSSRFSGGHCSTLCNGYRSECCFGYRIYYDSISTAVTAAIPAAPVPATGRSTG
ncbi:hypothetical protein PYK79_46575 [Streptomyces sp. ID05-04B]|uniref:hypothetical protein n=1 Tax=Streptomyces sp. ID05-04B TaxID=3028661 RepID=UPI0029C3FAED|nr:hypothetical protein [Streptomyces sp. ID05-04B]MDX5569273.1 hypothetical protein [Streptomyces sp. ID05-04B]